MKGQSSNSLLKQQDMFGGHIKGTVVLLHSTMSGFNTLSQTQSLISDRMKCLGLASLVIKKIIRAQDFEQGVLLNFIKVAPNCSPIIGTNVGKNERPALPHNSLSATSVE